MPLRISNKARESDQRAIDLSGVSDPVVNLVQFGPLVRAGETVPPAESGHMVPAVFPRSTFSKSALFEVEGITFAMPRYMRWFLPMTLDATEHGLDWPTVLELSHG